MQLYLIRHATAAAIDEAHVKNDEERPLTPVGIGEARNLGRFLKQQAIQFDVLAVSPLTRTQQTAHEMLSTLGQAESLIELREELKPGLHIKKWTRFLNGESATSIAIVGHQPDLSRFCAWLIGNKRVQIDFAKGAIASLVVDGPILKGCAILQWLVTPELLAGLTELE